MKRFKDWLKVKIESNTDRQFTIVNCIETTGAIKSVRRINDGKIFIIHHLYKNDFILLKNIMNLKHECIITRFHEDMKHVDFDFYIYEDGELKQKGRQTLPINAFNYA